VAKLVEELLGPWKTPRPFVRVPARHFERPALDERIVTPDKANAVLRAGLGIRMRDDHPDFPALVLANYLLGGGSTARLPERIREKEGLSYSTYSSFHASAFDQAASLRIAAIFAPENLERVRVALREELERALREGFSALEIETGKQALLEARRMSRAQDRALAHRLGSYLFMKRTFEWDMAFEKSIAALTPAQVHAAMKRHLDPARLAVVVAGDLKKK
jgi:zinc protease